MAKMVSWNVNTRRTKKEKKKTKVLKDKAKSYIFAPKVIVNNYNRF